MRIPPVWQLRTVVILVGLLVGCGGGPPDEESLRDAFAEQIASVAMVSDLERDGDELTFIGPGVGMARQHRLGNRRTLPR